MPIRFWTILTLVFVLALLSLHAGADNGFRFVILGDRMGEAQPGVFEQICKEAAAERPAFALSIGDSIQGIDDAKMDAEWRDFDSIRDAFLHLPLYLAAGNHDVWSAASAQAFVKHSGHPLRYSFDYGELHVTVLDTSQSDELSAADLAFLEADLKAHATQPLKLVISHRPTWLIDVAGQNLNAPLHRLAKRYGVRYIVAGHIHQLLRFDFDGITYLSMPSAGGHLRLAKDYAGGWFFGHARVDIAGANVEIQMEEAGPPVGQGRVTNAAEWGMVGLLKK